MVCRKCQMNLEHSKDFNRIWRTKIIQEIDESNFLKEDYEERFAILKLLNYVDQNNGSLIKAGVTEKGFEENQSLKK